MKKHGRNLLQVPVQEFRILHSQWKLQLNPEVSKCSTLLSLKHKHFYFSGGFIFHLNQLRYLLHQSDLCFPDILCRLILRNSFYTLNISMRQIYYFSTLCFSTVGCPRSHHLFCETTSNRSGSVRRENQEHRNEGDFTGGRSQGNISLLFPLKTTRAVVPRATSMQNRLIQRFHNITPRNPLPCDLETSSATQYFPGGGGERRHRTHRTPTTCVKDSAERK